MTHAQYISANASGLAHRTTGQMWSYYTPSLQVAYNLGHEGIDLSIAEVVTGFRYGNAPESFISWNYAANASENGLSIYTENSIIRSEFLDRNRVEVSGISAGTGSDGEALILAYNAINLD